MKILTIRDIARLSGVGVTTVSRVLNHRPQVSAETREKVERVIAQSGFVGNANARGLKQTENRIVSVIVRGRQSIFLNSVVESIYHHAARQNMTYVAEHIDESADEFKVALRLCQEKRPAALVFIGSAIDRRAQVFSNVDVPAVFVTVNTEGTILEHKSSVCIDDEQMAYEVMQSIIRQGHEHIALLGGSRKGNDVFARRYQGSMRAIREQGLHFDPTSYSRVRFSMRDAEPVVRKMMEKHPETTAFFCMSDTVAIGTIRTLTDMGYRVPDDVSVFGFDGIEEGSYLVPRLSTVEQPVDLLASTCVEMLNELINHHAPAAHVTVRAELHIRESLKPPHNNSTQHG